VTLPDASVKYGVKLDPSIYRFRANARLVGGGPPNTIMGPVACQACGQHVYYSHSTTRASFPDGSIIRGRLCWRDKGGAVHECRRTRKRRRPDKRGNPLERPMTRPDPACMTPDELARWHAANATLNQPALRACQDCLPWWAEAMRAQGRCNGEPGEPPAVIRTLTPNRREANRINQQRWRERQRAMLTAARV